MNKYNFDYYKESADYILHLTNLKPRTAIILGSSLGKISSCLYNCLVIKYKDIPNFLECTNDSHAGELIIGIYQGIPLLILSGRFHHYEGYDYEDLAVPIRVLKIIGIENIILTNIAGAINEKLDVGDIMVIKDHIKLNGYSPMRGLNIAAFGERFYDVSYMYTPLLRDKVQAAAQKIGIGQKVFEGVYYYMPGPQFETPAEINAIRILGGDAVGMSTVTEALTAAHCNMGVLALSLIVNLAAGINNQIISNTGVSMAIDRSIDYLQELIMNVVVSIG